MKLHFLIYFSAVSIFLAEVVAHGQSDEPDDIAIKELKEQLADPDKKKEDLHLIEKELARAYIRKNDFGNAITHMQNSINLQEKPPEQEFQAIGRLLMEEERFDEAIPVLRKGEQLYPDSINIAMLLTAPLRAQENWKDAAKQYEKVEKLSSELTDQSLGDIFYFQYGSAAERSGDIEKAAQLFQKSLELIPKGREESEFRATVLNYLGYMWLENDMNIDVAGELVKKAAKLHPDSGAIADSLGWYYFKKERYIEAMSELTRAEAMMEEPDPVVMDHIAQTFFKIGNKEDAVQYMKKAVELDPDNEEFRKRLKEYSKN